MSLALDPAAQDLLFREARTANTFTDEPVTDEQVQAIYDLVKYGPTAFNQTPLRITLVDQDRNDRDARVVLKAIDINKGNKQVAHGIDRVLRPIDL